MKKLLLIAFLSGLITSPVCAGPDPQGSHYLESISDSDAVGIISRRGRGTFDEKSGVASGDSLFFIKSYGYDGTGTYRNGNIWTIVPSASISMTATEAWSSTANGSDIRFNATPVGSVTAQEVLRLSPGYVVVSGSVTVGGGSSIISSSQTAGLAFYVNDTNVYTLFTSSSLHTGTMRHVGLQVDVSSSITVPDNGGGTDASYTLNPSRSLVYLTCSDAQDTDITMGETGAIDGTVVTIVNIAAGTCSFADSAGVSELAGAFVMGAADMLTLRYVSNTWGEVSRSNN